MDDSSTLSTTPSTLRRRNSIPTSVVVPNKLALPATPPHRSSFQSLSNGINTPTNMQAPPSLLDVELQSIKSPFCSYTSLRDLLPSSNAAINSPTSSSAITNSGYEISIRNRLVKQAAWAYLQPMSASPNSSSGPDFLHRLWQRLSSGRRNPLSACLSFILHQLVPGTTRIFLRILRSIRGHVSTYAGVDGGIYRV